MFNTKIKEALTRDPGNTEKLLREYYEHIL